MHDGSDGPSTVSCMSAIALPAYVARLDLRGSGQRPEKLLDIGGHTNHSANGIVVRREVQDVWEAFFADEERKDVVLQLKDGAETDSSRRPRSIEGAGASGRGRFPSVHVFEAHVPSRYVLLSHGDAGPNCYCRTR